ncbi:MAG TPA: VOC family protein [Alphaproteobacteria bacterium]|nr:VOC family protein [Alphaproteobacteria bacterium]
MTTDIVARDGCPLSVAVLGVADMETSLHFYRDLTGLTASDPVTWSGPDFERLWHLPAGAGAEAVFLHADPDPVGRILLLAFDAPERKIVRADKPPRAYGLINLNFYTSDIFAETEKFRALGYEFWSDPVAHEFTDNVGTPIEVVFEGPDGVLINWVELASDDPETRIGKMRAYVESFGRTPAGFTPVVTSAHCMRSVSEGRAFYETVLHMGVHINQVLDSENYRKFQRVPEGGRTRVTFMQGNHMFGKIATSEPLNYEVPDLTPDAVAPNIGYLAQTFLVPDMDAAERDCVGLGAEVYTPRMDIESPGLGMIHTMIVRNPGSGALQQLVQA